MKIYIPFFLAVAMVAVFCSKSIAQGCSDAGFCTIGNLNQHAKNTTLQNKQKLTLILSNGIGDENVYVFTPGIQYDYKLNSSWSVQGKITGNYANGNLGHASGFGDLFLSATYSLPEKNNWQTSFLFGTKLPLNKGDIHAGNKPLPMQYQSSLGTIDLLAGFSISSKKWLISGAVQQPLTGNNRNTFLHEYWGTDEAKKYSPSNDFKRRGDVLLRTNYSLITKTKLDFNVGLLGIYHFGKDTYINGNLSNDPIVLAGSEGLTLNGTAVIRYRLNDKLTIGLSGGVPFVVRDIRPDGLTRKFVLSPEFSFNF
ncbi:MAG: hypothetical protein ABIU77_13355 [Ferruginibacter sp.]